VIRVPPKPLRRLVIAPLVGALDVAVLAASPVLLAVAALLSPVFGARRPLRAGVIVIAFAARHLQALGSLLELRLRPATGDPQAAHYAVMRRFVGTVYDIVERCAGVRLVVEAAGPVVTDPGRPVIVLARHAGEGDTLLVLHAVLCRHGRDPRMVMHEALQLDPVIDVLGTRLPNAFLDPRGGDTEREVAALARGLDGRSALIIFPEGANFTPEHRQKAIERLERGGFEREAASARAMRHVSAPRPGGALAAIEAAPDADVLIVGHAGFPVGFGEAWRILGQKHAIALRSWRYRADSLPADTDARIAWLFARWAELDAWIEQRTRAG
jgi:1-acyl-sn-glycerol-3-phosphate acyltransferase